ncbi:MAG: VWA domain-containing protein [bacterium]
MNLNNQLFGGKKVGILNMWGALAALSIFPIAYLYFFKHEKTVLEVSSMLTWNVLDEDRSTHRSSFLFDYILLLQILIALVMTLIMLRLFYLKKVNYKYKIMLFDVSASMNSLEKGDKKRIDNARAEALKFIDDLKENAKVAIIQVGYTAKKLVDFTDNKYQLKKVIENINAQETGADFSGAFSMVKTIREEFSNSSLVIVSDLSDFSNEMFSLDISDIPTRYLDFPYETSNNVGITSLDVHQNVYDSSNQKVYITVQSSASTPKVTTMNVFVGKRQVFTKKINLPPRGTRIIPLGQFKKAGIMKVALRINDALSADNQAYDIIRGKQTVRLLLVSDDQELIDGIRRIAKAAETLSLKILPTYEFSRKKELLEKTDIVIFHRFTPGKFVSKNQIYIDPPVSSRLFKIDPGRLDKPDIVDWSRTSPLLKHLHYLDELRLNEVSRGELPDWGTPLFSSNRRTLSFWGERNQYKVVCFYFDLGKIFFPRNQDVTGLVMFLNLVDWLIPADDSVTKIQAGEKYILRLPGEMSLLKVIGPKGKERSIKVKDKVLTCADTGQVGSYMVEGFYKDTIRKYRRNFLVNLLSEDETSIAPRKIVFPEIKDTGRERNRKPQHLEKAEIWRHLTVAALMLLFLEWTLFFRRLE